MKSVPNSSEPGNTKLARKTRINPAKRWCFTCNNWKTFTFHMICSKIEQYCRYAIIGEEVGASGTPHLQGYIEFKEKMRPIGVFGIRELHWELARGSKNENIIYCSKEKLIYEFPKPYRQEIDELYNWELDILELLKTTPDDRTINWYWETDGCKGKTTFQKYIFGRFDKVVVLSGKGSDMKNGVLEFYKATHSLPKIILVNVPRCNQKYISYTGLEEIKDMFFYSPKYEGGMLCGPSPHVLVFANQPPDYKEMSEDRWNVIEI